MSRVGIFAGTFDPVHNGHIHFARQALQLCELSKVWFLVEPVPRKKQGVKAFEHRIKMVQLALHEESNLGSIVLEHPRFTVHDTLPLLANRFGGDSLSLLIGEDVLGHLTHWPHIGDLIDSVEFIIGVRKNSEQKIRETIRAIEKVRGHSFRYKMIHTDSSLISSSQVRAKVRRGLELTDISPTVAAYIKRHQLYAAV